MKSSFRHWRRFFLILIGMFLVAEILILHANQNQVRLQPVQIHHDESTYGPWVIVRVENPHLTPIRLLGLHPEGKFPMVAYGMERDRDDGSADKRGTGWCTSTFSIWVPPLSSREVKIPYPGTPGETTSYRYWKIHLWCINTSLLSAINPWTEEIEIRGSFNSADKLPITGDPGAKEAAERNSCCGGEEKPPSPPVENPTL